MSNEIVRWFVVIVVLAHGIGHVLFLAPALGIANWADQTGHSWLLSGAIGEGGTRFAASAVWIAAIVCFVAGVVGFLTGADWWRALILAGAVVSGVGIVVMWDGLAQPSAAMALAFDVVVLIAVGWANWPTRELIGS
jgi:hypothetical protein